MPITAVDLRDVIEQARKQADDSSALHLRASLRETKALKNEEITTGMLGLLNTMTMKKEDFKEEATGSTIDKLSLGSRDVVERLFVLGWLARELSEFKSCIEEEK